MLGSTGGYGKYCSCGVSTGAGYDGWEPRALCDHGVGMRRGFGGGTVLGSELGFKWGSDPEPEGADVLWNPFGTYRVVMKSDDVNVIGAVVPRK